MSTVFITQDIWPQLTKAVRDSRQSCAVAVAYFGKEANILLPLSMGITSEMEEEQLETINVWMEQQGLTRGLLAYDYAAAATGEQKTVFDLAWPNGIQEELSKPVAVLLNESTETIGIASKAGYRCFTGIDEFRHYVENDILAGGSHA